MNYQKKLPEQQIQGRHRDDGQISSEIKNSKYLKNFI